MSGLERRIPLCRRIVAGSIGYVVLAALRLGAGSRDPVRVQALREKARRIVRTARLGRDA